MTTFATMRSRIADELARSDMTTEINRQINSAIKHYESMRTRFNEIQDFFIATTTSGQRYETLTGSATIVIGIDTVRLIYSGSRISLGQKSLAWIEDHDVMDTAISGVPYYYTMQGERIRLFPAPNGTYSLFANGIRRFSELSADADTNGWMTFGEELIRARAVAAVRVQRLKVPWAMEEYRGLAGRYYSLAEKCAHQAFADETYETLATGLIRPSW